MRNYTSSISVQNSVNAIEVKLTSAGADRIVKIYTGEPKRLTGITFSIFINGVPQLYKLPANDEAVYKIFLAKVKRITPEARRKVMEQAQRTAWKLLHDWIDVQLALIEIKQIELQQIFLPYAYNPQTDKTFFQMLTEQGGITKLLSEVEK